MSPTAKSTPIDRERSVLRVSWNWPPENFMEGSSSVGEIRWSLVQNIRVRKLGIPPQSIFTLRFWKQLHLKYRLKVVVYTCVFYLFSRVWKPSVQVDTSLNFGDTLEDMLFRQSTTWKCYHPSQTMSLKQKATWAKATKTTEKCKWTPLRMLGDMDQRVLEGACPGLWNILLESNRKFNSKWPKTQ